MSNAFPFVTPEGRLVAGSFTQINTTDHQNKPLAPEKHNWFVGLAFPKTTAQWYDEQGELGAVFGALRSAAAEHYKGQEFQNTAFAWKIDNGDDPKHASKEGYAGNWILKFTRYVAIGACKVYNTQNAEVIDPAQIKRGYYYRISGSAKANGNTGTQAGVYVNMDMAQLKRQGKEIVSGPTAEQVFGPATGVPSTPQAAYTAPSGPAPSAPTPPAAPVSAPATPGVAPAPQFASGGGFAPAPAPASPVEVKRLYQGVAYTEAALKSAGHSDELIASYPVA